MPHTFEGPGLYRITVKGQLDMDDSDRLGGMSITTREDAMEQGVISIEGQEHERQGMRPN